VYSWSRAFTATIKSARRKLLLEFWIFSFRPAIKANLRGLPASPMCRHILNAQVLLLLVHFIHHALLGLCARALLQEVV
jgi:hypothetical protein